ncbi:MAG: PD40 domain-containing protein [Candidatus Coatesbacteria bacterium]|nr:MAG: PD40 domain-containing protein [Candidatus Coatesbacteria bacterium]
MRKLLLYAAAAALLLSCADEGPEYMFVPEPGADGRVRIFDFCPWFDISPDAKELAYVNWKSGSNMELIVYNFDTGRERVLTTWAGGPIWSPDGRWITYAKQNNGGLWVVRRDGAGDRLLYWDPYGCGPFDWSPDGTKVLFGTYRAQPRILDIYYYDLFAEKAFFITTTEYSKPGPFAVWFPTGDRFVTNRVVGAEEVVSIIDFDGRLVRDIWRFEQEVFTGYVRGISRSGDRLIFEVTGYTAGGRPRISGNWVLDLKTHRWKQALYNRDPAHINDGVARWLPDGRVVFNSWRTEHGKGLGIYTVNIP